MPHFAAYAFKILRSDYIMKIATTIGEVYAYTKDAADAVRFYKDTGFKYLDYNFYRVLSNPDHPFLKDDWRDGILAAKDAADELGFKFVQAHAPDCYIRGSRMQEGIDLTVRSIEACGMLGIENMVIHSGFFSEFKYPDDKLAWFKANEPFFRVLIPAMEKNNVKILFENTSIKLCGGVYFTIRGKDLAEHVEFMNHPLFGAAWDVGHAHMDGLDHHDEIMDIGGALKAIHVHDNDGSKDMHTIPFAGTLDYDSLMRGLIDSGFNGYFTLECDCFLRHDRRASGDRLAHPGTELKHAGLSLMYLAAKNILEAYGVYED